MTQTGPGSPQQPGGKDDEVFRELTRMQVQVILEAYGADVEVGFDRTTKGDDLADVAYLCRSGAILVRDPDLSRVQRIDLGARVDDALVDGLTRLTLPAGLSVADALERIDAAVGLGVATPDHLLWVTPKSFSCPATEPEEVSVKDSVPTVGRGSEAGRGVLVSVVDTGWHSPAATDPVSPWLAGVTGDEEEITDPSDPNGFIRPYAGHGTFVAGVVRREAPAAEVRVEGFLRKAGAIFESKIVRQLTEAIALGPDIISLSAGSTTRENLPLLSFEVFYERFLSKLKGTVLVAAAGNQGVRKPFWPAAFPWSISVGALDALGHRADFSNFGSWVDVYALGVDLVNAYPHGDFKCVEPPHVGDVRHFEGLCRWSGTSFSTPLVAGRIAARMSATGLSARLAADQLLAEARAGSVPGVGPCL